MVPTEKPSLPDNCFRSIALGIAFLSVFTQVFDFSLAPPSFHGIYITRPFSELHSWARANHAWAARNHVKYGLRYTRGYRTVAVGDPPPAHPQRYVSHPPLDTWITALGMLVFGTGDLSVRLFDVVLSVPVLLLILVLLRRLYGGTCALLSGLLLVMFPLSAFFGYASLTVLFGLWALCRYLAVIGRLGDGSKQAKRYLFELAVALFLLVQMSWVGVFYAFVLGAHYIITGLVCRRVRASTLSVLLLASLLSLTLNLSMMVCGYRSNIRAEALTRGQTQWGYDRDDTALSRVKALYLWRASKGERGSFSWTDWLVQNARFALKNFTAPALLLVAAYLFYLLLTASDPDLFGTADSGARGGAAAIRRPFLHMWFFLLPGLLFLLTFRGLIWMHEYWQAPLVMFVALAVALALLLLGDLFGTLHPWLGRSVITVSVVILAVFCNRGLTSYRAVRWQSSRTISLFKELNRRIPPDKALLTFKDFVVRQCDAKTPFYRPEYAWYLDRDMIVANAWRYDADWVRSARISEVVEATVIGVRLQAQTGRFPVYFVPAREETPHDPLQRQFRGQRVHVVVNGKPQLVASLEPSDLERLLNDGNRAEDEILIWEKHRRYREALTAMLKEFYPYEYYDNPAGPGDPDSCYSGNTPCYLFDLTHPRF